MPNAYTQEEAIYRDPMIPVGILNKIAYLPRKLYICERCSHYVPMEDSRQNTDPGLCKIVEGRVNQKGSCKLWSYFGVRPVLPKNARIGGKIWQ